MYRVYSNNVEHKIEAKGMMIKDGTLLLCKDKECKKLMALFQVGKWDNFIIENEEDFVAINHSVEVEEEKAIESVSNDVASN